MNAHAHALALALLRTTLGAAVAACLATLLLSSLKVAAPRMHRIAWALVVLQGWLLVPWTFKIESRRPVEHALPLGGMSSSAWTWSDFNSPSIQQPAVEAPSHDHTIFLAPLAILTWLTGAALAACLAAARYARILRTLPLGAAPDAPQWQAEWRNASCAMPTSAWACLRHSTKRRPARVDFRITDRLGPLLAYIPFTYLILAPRPLWTSLTGPERTAILRHELAHLLRRDLWKSLALRALALPQWFNPLVWLAVRRFDEAAEWACDDAATAVHPNDHLTLANSLLHAAEFATTTPCGAVAVQGGVLSRRIHRLVTPRFKEESTMRKLAVPALLAALATAQLIRIERVAAENPPPSKGWEQPSTADPKSAERRAVVSAEGRGGIPDDGLISPLATRREYKESAWPRYIVEPPDILAIDAIKLVPKAPHRLEAFDVMIVRVVGALPEHPIDDTYSVDADGTINLGPKYGRIRVAGLTIEEAEEHIRAELSKMLTDVEASASLVASAGAQQITGQHLVAMDGRVNLGIYGSVYVAGLTIEETREAIEQKLAEKLEQPQVSVDVLSYNSKVYYVITKGGEKGDNVVRAPITGNDTVLDAIANLGGMSVDAVTKIWIARPAPNGVGKETILPVNWSEIAQGAEPATNYQLMPGDRLFIEPPHPANDSQPKDATMRVAPPAEPVVETPAGDLGAYAAEAAPAGPGNAYQPVEFQPPAGAAGPAASPPASPPVAPHPLAADSLDAAAPTPAARVAELQVHDIVTVLMDPVREEGIRPPSFRIACEIKEIRPNGNLYLEGQAAIRNIDQWPELSLSGEVRREEIRPDRTVSSRSIVNLKINKREVRVQAKSPTITIVLRQKGGETLMDQLYVAGKTIGDVLHGAVYPNPINFAEAVISLERSQGEGAAAQTTHSAIGWDVSRSRPTKDDDRALEPGDCIVLDLSQQSGRVLPPSSDVPDLLLAPTVAEAPAAPQPVDGAAPPAPGTPQVLFKLSVIRDHSGDVAELGASLCEDGAATGDTESILGVLRILRKHKLIDTLADPTIVTVVGRPASIELHTEIFQSSPYDRGDHNYVVTVNPKSIGGDAEGSLLRLEVNLAHDEAVDRGFDLHFGETVIFASSPHDKLGPGQTYVVITPKLVK